jgi:hypothetical protein
MHCPRHPRPSQAAKAHKKSRALEGAAKFREGKCLAKRGALAITLKAPGGASSSNVPRKDWFRRKPRGRRKPGQDPGRRAGNFEPSPTLETGTGRQAREEAGKDAGICQAL